MADTKSIKNKLKTVGTIKKITRAMEMVSRSKMKKAVDRALSIRPYAVYSLEFLKGFSYIHTHPSVFYTSTEGSRHLLLLITSNRGLCGGYNTAMYRMAKEFVATHLETDIVCIGTYAKTYAKNLGIEPLHSVTSMTGEMTLDVIEDVATILKEKFISGVYAEVHIAHTTFISLLSQKPTIKKLLPLSFESVEEETETIGGAEDAIAVETFSYIRRHGEQYVVEPSPEVILDTIIPKLITVQIFESILESFASEEAARMMAMKNASDNADAMEERLSLAYNHMRQESITRELSEIVAGVESMSQ